MAPSPAPAADRWRDPTAPRRVGGRGMTTVPAGVHATSRALLAGTGVDHDHVLDVVRAALAEDLAWGPDITTEATIAPRRPRHRPRRHARLWHDRGSGRRRGGPGDPVGDRRNVASAGRLHRPRSRRRPRHARATRLADQRAAAAAADLQNFARTWASASSPGRDRNRPLGRCASVRRQRSPRLATGRPPRHAQDRPWIRRVLQNTPSAGRRSQPPDGSRRAPP